jgi:hypothetical protein
MRKTNCNAIRRELDEIRLGESYSASVLLHLQQCSDCQEFHQTRTKLRQLVGSLETVEAPADFDFRLRARLANGKPGSVHWFTFAGWSSPGARSAVLAGFILLVGAVVVLDHWRGSKNTATVAGVGNPATQPPLVLPKGSEGVVLPNPVTPPNGAVAIVNPTSRLSHKNVVAMFRPRQSLVAKDSSLLAGLVVRREESVATVEVPAVFPIDTSYQSLKVSWDDGHGTWRTISLPTVSFGSQRVLATGSLSNQLAPKGVW